MPILLFIFHLFYPDVHIFPTDAERVATTCPSCTVELKGDAADRCTERMLAGLPCE